MTAQLFAKVVGVILIPLGVLGLILGEGQLAGLLNIDLVENIIHLATGALYAYVGFARTDPGLLRNVVGGLGVVYTIVGALGFIVPEMFGLIPSGYSFLDNLIHLVIGIGGIALGFFATAPTTSTAAG